MYTWHLKYFVGVKYFILVHVVRQMTIYECLEWTESWVVVLGDVMATTTMNDIGADQQHIPMRG